MRKILLLPGLGDVHWVFLKLKDWLRRKGWDGDHPEIWIWNIDNRPRTLEYLQFVPWVKAGGYWDFDFRKEKRVFDELYLHKNSGDHVLDFHGFDAFIGMNGNMRQGVPFSELLDGAAIDYDYGPRLLPDPFGSAEKQKGQYFVLCFSGFGMFAHDWVRSMPPDMIRSMIRVLRRHYPGHRFLFTGCAWDDSYSQQCMSNRDESLVGKTTLPQFFSLMLHSSGYIGWCGGNSIIAQHMGVPTVEWWSRNYFPHHDRKGWETPHETKRHLVLDVEAFDLRRTTDTILKFLSETGHEHDQSGQARVARGSRILPSQR